VVVMGEIKFNPRMPSMVIFSFDEQTLFRETLTYVETNLNGQIVDSDIVTKSFSITLRNLEYLVVSKSWNPIDMEFNSEVIDALKDFHKDQQQFHSATESWDSSKIIAKLKHYNPMRHPTPFQMENLVKMLQHPSAASFSVPGSGKTSEGLCYWLCRRAEGEKLLVVLPKVGFIAWEEEFEAWIGWDSSKVVRLDVSGDSLLQKVESSTDAEVFLITYARLYYNVEQLSTVLNDGDWSMVLDESHNIKNSKGAYSKAVRNIGSCARRTKLILTGTPAPQGSKDLLAQVEFLRNAKMGIDESVDWIKQIKVRTTKSQLELLPPKFLEYSEPLPSSHQQLYNLLISGAARNIEASGNLEYASKLNNIRRHMMDIMRAASNPAVLCEKEEFTEVLSPDLIARDLSTPSWKIKKVTKLVSDIIGNGRKVIVWSNFNENTDILANELRHLSPRVIRGDTPSAASDDLEPDGSTREGILRDFKALDSCNVLIANPAACGESISLHHWCHDAIYFDRNYNAGQFLQSCDRIHRYGSLPGSDIITCAEIEVTYHILQSAGTIDGKIARSLKLKIERQENILANDDFLQPLVAEGTDELDISGMSDADRQDFLNYIKNPTEVEE